MAESARRVAIACQGGGSHTAFTAGVLGGLLGAEGLDRYEIVGLSGTSGGAVCALLAWTAVADGDPGRAKELLQGFWADNAATSAPDRMVNAATLWMSTMANVTTMPAVSPYDSPVAAIGLDSLLNDGLLPPDGPYRPIMVRVIELLPIVCPVCTDRWDPRRRSTGIRPSYVTCSAMARSPRTSFSPPYASRTPGATRGPKASGRAVAQFSDGRITNLRLGPVDTQ